jgi:transglutaminase-like putative cysteine protease
MRYKLRHQTVYTYEEPVDNYQSVLCLQPRTQDSQICHSFDLEVSPCPIKIHSRIDFFGNTLAYFSLHEPHNILKVVSTSDVEVLPKNLPSINALTCAEVREMFVNNRPLKIELLQYCPQIL